MALTRAQYMQPPGEPGVIGAVSAGTSINITTTGLISWTGGPATSIAITPIPNLNAANVQDALTQLESQIQSLSGSTILAGLYNAQIGQLTYATPAGAASGFVPGQNLPAPSASIVNFYVIVTTGGNIGPSGTQPSSSGDWWICQNQGGNYLWFLINFDDTFIPAQNVIVTAIPGIPTASNAQEALTQLEAQTNDRVQKVVLAGGGQGVRVAVSAPQPVYEGTTLTVTVDQSSVTSPGTTQLTNSVQGVSEVLALTQRAGNELNARIDQLSGQQVLAGTYNCSNGTLAYVTPSASGKGFVVGQNCPPASLAIDGYYVIVITGGSQAPPGVPGPSTPFNPGDWFICEGASPAQWVPINFDNTIVSASNVTLNPPVNGKITVQESSQDLNARLIQCLSNLVSDTGIQISVRSSTSDGRTFVANLLPSNPSNLGGVIVPGSNGLRVDSSGVLDLTPATPTQLGGLRVGKGISVDAFGIVTVNAPKILDNLTFNGTQTSFTLKSGNVAISPPLPSDLLIFVGGVAQTQGSYNLVSSDIVFSEAPPANATFYGILLYY